LQSVADDVLMMCPADANYLLLVHSYVPHLLDQQVTWLEVVDSSQVACHQPVLGVVHHILLARLAVQPTHVLQAGGISIDGFGWLMPDCNTGASVAA
jgi:hypothetical protein